MISLAPLPHGRHLVRYSQVPWGTCAYLLSARGATKLLRRRMRVRSYDAALKYPWLLNLHVLGVFPPAVTQSAQFRSSINDMEDGHARDHSDRWWRPTVSERGVGLIWTIRALGVVGFARCLAYRWKVSFGRLVDRLNGQAPRELDPVLPRSDEKA